MSPVTPLFAPLCQKKESYKSRKVNKMNKMAISASTFIEMETNEIQRREIIGREGLLIFSVLGNSTRKRRMSMEST